MTTTVPLGRPIGTAHVYCDESGGSDAANATFLCAAVSILPADAQRLMKDFRKATGIAGEVKGHRLQAEHRAIFFDLLVRRADSASAVVTCSRGDPLGGWAMGELPEVGLYRHLLAEACIAVPDLDIAGHLTVTPDGGRYKKAQLGTVRDHLARAVMARHPLARVHVEFGVSGTIPGLQVADVIANSVFQSLGTRATAETARLFLAPLAATGRLTITGIRMEGIRPAWLEKV